MRKALAVALIGAAMVCAFAAQAQSAPTAAVSWGAVVGATSYNLERKAQACANAADSSGTWSVIQTTGLTAYVDTAVAAGNAYCYRANASNESGTSVYSNTAGKTFPLVPSAPVIIVK